MRMGQRTFFLHDGRTSNATPAIDPPANGNAEDHTVIPHFTGLSANQARKGVSEVARFPWIVVFGRAAKVSRPFFTRQYSATFTYMNPHSKIRSALLFVYCLYAITAHAADSIHGKVLNQTISRPSAGDEVVLLRMGNGMEEEARTRTDAEGAFSLPVSGSNAPHVVRVLHKAVNYDQTVSGTAPLEISVYDAVPKIPGLSSNLGIAQVESDGTRLKLTEMYSINNVSNPPVTQSGPRNFTISLPPKAVLDSVMVKWATGIWVNITPSQAPGSENRYALDFPLRPGNTLFKFIYWLPDEGSTSLRLKLPYPVQNFAVLHPPSMSFKASRPQAFSSPGLVQGMKLEQAVSKPVVGEAPAFEISGSGTASAPVASGTIFPTQPVAPPGAHLNIAPGQTPSTASAPSTKEIWTLGSAFACFLIVMVAVLWRRKGASKQRATPSRQNQILTMEALKQELLQLEIDKLRGTITTEQYHSCRQALDLSIKRTVANRT